MIGGWRDFQVFWQQPGNGFVKIIALNGGIFVLLMFFRLISIFSGHSLLFESVVESMMLSSQVTHFIRAPWSLITYFFVHVEVFHLVFNMMFLYWFGMIIQEVVGNTKSLQIYFGGGISGAIAFFLAYHYIPYFANRGEAYLLGASAGVFAIVVAAATLRPNYEVMLFLIGSVRIKYIAGFYMLWSILETVGANAGGNIAHLGGAFGGFCMA